MDRDLIYLDNAATTRPDPAVIEEMLRYLTEEYGNPSAKYSIGYNARNAVNEARERTGALIGAEPENIYFTGSGTESDNIAVISAMTAEDGTKGHMIVSAAEHPAVLNTARKLQKSGYGVTFINPGRDGIVTPEAVERELRSNTRLVSVMTVSNELGAIEPVKEICALAHEKGCLFHTDAVQAYGKMKLDIRDTGADYLSASAHKIYGPKGVGLLYCAKGAPLRGIMSGGEQEYGIRPGTENVAAIAGFGRAAVLAAERMDAETVKMNRLQEYIIGRILGEIPQACLNGPPVGKNRLPGLMNFSFAGIRGASLVLRLDIEKICISTGSACTAGSDRPSHVLAAAGLDDWQINGSVRISPGAENTLSEAETAVERIKYIVGELRYLNGCV